MECLEFRRICETEPSCTSTDFLTHAEECEACGQQLDRARRFDALIGAALRVDVPRSDHDRFDLRAPSSRARRWLGVAAAALLACGVSVAFWLAGPERPALTMEVVDHVRGEPAALRADAAPLTPASVQGLLARYGVRLREGIGAVTYIRLCPFHGTLVPHFVVRGPEGPVTVLILIGRPVRSVTTFEMGQFSGELVPTRTGSVAIVGYRRRVDSAQATRILAAIEWDA